MEQIQSSIGIYIVSVAFTERSQPFVVKRTMVLGKLLIVSIWKEKQMKVMNILNAHDYCVCTKIDNMRTEYTDFGSLSMCEYCHKMIENSFKPFDPRAIENDRNKVRTLR